MTSGVRFERFEAVAALDPAAQKALLLGSDPVQRIWAAWAIGMRLGARAVPDLVISLDSAPEPGTRRQLIVVLAGLGEREILRRFATDDPDDLVRASACQYLIQTATPSDRHQSDFLAARLREDASAAVRQVILRLAPDIVRNLSSDDLAQIVTDADVEVRRLAVDAALSMLPMQALFPGILEERIAAEPDAVLRHRLIESSLAAGGGQRLLTLAYRLPDPYRADILHALVQRDQHFSWHALAPLAGLGASKIDAAIVRMIVTEDAPSAFPWLLACVDRAIHWPLAPTRSEDTGQGDAWECAWKAEEIIRTVAPRLDSVRLDEDTRATARSVATALESGLVSNREEFVEEWPNDPDAVTAWSEDREVQNRQQLIRALRRLGGDTGS